MLAYRVLCDIRRSSVAPTSPEALASRLIDGLKAFCAVFANAGEWARRRWTSGSRCAGCVWQRQTLGLVALIVLSALNKLSLRRHFTTTRFTITQLRHFTTQLAASMAYTLIAGRVRQCLLVMNFHDVGRVRFYWLVSR